MHLSNLHEDMGAPDYDEEDVSGSSGLIPRKPKSYGQYSLMSSYDAMGQLVKMILRSYVPDPIEYREVQYLVKALKTNPKFYKDFYNWLNNAKQTRKLEGLRDYPSREIHEHELENLYALTDYLKNHMK